MFIPGIEANNNSARLYLNPAVKRLRFCLNTQPSTQSGVRKSSHQLVCVLSVMDMSAINGDDICALTLYDFSI